jgi:hypothetical protein
MGFLHKFLSLRSKKSKRRAAYETRSLPLSRDSQEWRRLQEEQEEIASRLLRSSSLRYAVVNEVDYSSLPPLREYNSSSYLDTGPLTLRCPLQHTPSTAYVRHLQLLQVVLQAYRHAGRTQLLFVTGRSKHLQSSPMQIRPLTRPHTSWPTHPAKYGGLTPSHPKTRTVCTYCDKIHRLQVYSTCMTTKGA